MARSALSLASDISNVEILAYVDTDDKMTQYHIKNETIIKSHIGPRQEHLSETYNILYPLARGSILLIGADDVIFKTQDWDRIVRDQFRAIPDGIVLLKPTDEDDWGKTLACHPFVPKSLHWALGYVTPHGLSRCVDGWLWHLFSKAERIRDAHVEIYHKREHFSEWTLVELNRKLEGDLESFTSRHEERERDAEKLLHYIKNPSSKRMFL